MNCRLSVLCCAGLLAAFVGLANAQNIRDDIELNRDVIQTQRKATVMNNLGLTDAESKAFWPIYNSYRDEMRGIGDRMLEVIQKYAKDYNANTLNDDKARILIKDWFTVKKNRLKIKEKYVERFAQAIPRTKVLRFFQIDNKIDAVLDVEISRAIPLAE